MFFKMGRDDMVSTQRRQAPDGKVYYSYTDIHLMIAGIVKSVNEFKPDVIVAIGGGGFIPARMIRSWLKIPMVAVSLKLYDDKTDTARQQVERLQWLDDVAVRGKRVLIVDEVDDTRKTLQYCIEELQRLNGPAAVAVAVVHNKVKNKVGKLPEGVQYFSCEDISDVWVVYPWEATKPDCDIQRHEQLARYCKGGSGILRNSPLQWFLALAVFVGLVYKKRWKSTS